MFNYFSTFKKIELNYLWDKNGITFIFFEEISLVILYKYIYFSLIFIVYGKYKIKYISNTKAQNVDYFCKQGWGPL